MKILHTENQSVKKGNLIPTQNQKNWIPKKLIIKHISRCASSRKYFLQSTKKDQNIILFWSFAYKLQANSFALAQDS